MSLVLADERVFNDIFADTIDCKKIKAVNGDIKTLKNETLSVTGQATVAHLTVGTLVYPESGPSGGYPMVKGSQLTFLSRVIATGAGPFLSAGDHLTWSTPSLFVGTNILIDTTSPYTSALNTPSTGRITLQPGIYHLRASCLDAGTGFFIGACMTRFRNSDTGAIISIGGAGNPHDMLLTDETIFTTASVVRVEFAIIINNGWNSCNHAIIEIEQLA